MVGEALSISATTISAKTFDGMATETLAMSVISSVITLANAENRSEQMKADETNPQAPS
jgi:hypothetical protein